jgi:hypothetical protein
MYQFSQRQSEILVSLIIVLLSFVNQVLLESLQQSHESAYAHTLQKLTKASLS